MKYIYKKKLIIFRHRPFHVSYAVSMAYLIKRLVIKIFFYEWKFETIFCLPNDSMVYNRIDVFVICFFFNICFKDSFFILVQICMSRYLTRVTLQTIEKKSNKHIYLYISVTCLSWNSCSELIILVQVHSNYSFIVVRVLR